MTQRGRTALHRYAFAVVCTAAALCFDYFLLDFKTTFLPCMAAVMLASWRGGPKPAILCALIIATVTSYIYFFHTVHTSAGAPWNFAIRESLFIAVSALAVMIASAQRKAEAESQAQGGLLLFTLAHSANGVIIAGEDGRIVFMNPRAHRLTGFGAEALGMPAGDVLKIADLDTFKPLENPIHRALREGVPARLEAPVLLISHDGRRYVIEDSASTFSAQENVPRNVVLIFRDVTEQRRIEAELRSTADRFRMALDAGRLSTWEWNIATGEIVCEELKMLLPPGSKGTRDEYLKAVHPDDRAAVERALNKALEEKRDFASEYRFIDPERNILWRSSLARPIFNDAGVAVSMVGVSRDITEQRLVEQIVREGAEQFRSVAENATDGFVTVDERGKIVYANAASAALFGYARAELIGQPLSVLVPERLREQQARGFAAFMAGGQKKLDWRHVEFSARCKDGSEIPVEMSYSQSRSGQRRLFSAIVRDIGERKRNEQLVLAARERLLLAQRIAGIGMYEWDLRARTAKMSPESEALHGLSPGTFGGAHEQWRKLLHPDDLEPVTQRIGIVLASTLCDYSDEYRVVWPDGSVHWLATRGKIFRDDSGAPLRMLGAEQDSTERKVLEAERERILAREKSARAEAERASRMKDEFLATVSHELRTPLTAILGWSKMMLDDVLDSETSLRALESIDRNARAQAQLVEDLLDVSRIISGRMRVQLAPLNLADVVKTAVDSVRPTAQARKVEFELHLSPARVSGDVERMQQVAFNILFNAVKFSHRLGRIVVSVEASGAMARLSVRDYGKGIDPAFLPNLFQRFTQEESGSTRRHGGMGLGLAIVRHLVEMHGGFVRAESEGPGTGTTVTVELPLLREGDTLLFTNPLRTGSSSAVLAKMFTNLEDAHVLVVEDDADTRLMLVSALRRAGSRVSEAESAEHAFELFARERPQAILSDISLPGETGEALIAKVRAQPEAAGGTTPAIALTAYAREGDFEKLMASGFQFCLRKPVNPADVLEALSAVLGNGVKKAARKDGA
ncbi:MAG TPA: PAS domain S-box protein [Planctomycetota bacterium]|nr:PAS domain S-box protein [Planctomycetota bacterium]